MLVTDLYVFSSDQHTYPLWHRSQHRIARPPALQRNLAGDRARFNGKIFVRQVRRIQLDVDDKNSLSNEARVDTSLSLNSSHDVNALTGGPLANRRKICFILNSGVLDLQDLLTTFCRRSNWQDKSLFEGPADEAVLTYKRGGSR